jgi:tetratricopeptide (TPR) repeat protein
MNNVNLEELVNKAGQMALHNIWGENAYKINMAILKADNNNCGACTRLAKYYKLNNNIPEAKNMYLKALSIDPKSRGAINNLDDIERDEKESAAVDQIKTTAELLKEGQKSMLKGKYELASKLFSRAYSIEPLSAHAFNLAAAYKKMGRYDNIEKLYRQLIDGNHIQADIENINYEFKKFRLEEKNMNK